ncbi:MAG: aldehyde dehydrogenase family protein, partial [Hypericibacter sp.]
MAEAKFDPFVGSIFVDHEWRILPALSRKPVIDPSNLERVGEIATADASSLAPVLAGAVAAQRDWAALDAKSRAGLLHRLADSIETQGHRETATLMVREMGKPYAEAVGELMNVASIFRYFAELARDEGGQVAGPTSPGSLQIMRWFPIGVSAHILPFNFPIVLMAFTVAASLAAGNAVIVKPAEATSLCTLHFMRHFRLLPAGLVACVTGGAETAQALIKAPEIGAVAFTGSAEVGRRVA